MRIEAYSQIQQIYGAGKSNKTSKTSQAGYGQDAVEISSIGKDIQTAKSAVNSSSDIREDRTSSLKSSIESGTYNVSGESFADKLIQKYNEANGSF